ncbi:ER lumen protein-retaining receptor B-like [Hibiscus syriacus]|uniref:ER lumen protein-retaining receptor B-like n=1 Tax=Hibiscus syriacus TaxID=106335 RepID=UPI001920E46B|nr:ER lumen protein-retaining receptor B-like [Hibiscus syriacus]
METPLVPYVKGNCLEFICLLLEFVHDDLQFCYSFVILFGLLDISYLGCRLHLSTTQKIFSSWSFSEHVLDILFSNLLTQSILSSVPFLIYLLDTFRHYFLLLPCLLLALLIHEKFTLFQVLWTFSLYLEPVSILPQFVLLQRTQKYVFLLGAYQGLYILNWIYRYFTEPHYVHWIPWISGIVQTLLYADFFYYYFDSWKSNKRPLLPA